MAPLPTFTKRPGRKDLARSGSRRGDGGCQERAGPRPAPPPLAPGSPLFGNEFYGVWGEKHKVLDTPLPPSAFSAPLARKAWGSGRCQLPGIRGDREGPLWTWPRLFSQSGPLPRELRTCSSVRLASEAALPAQDPGLIQAHGVASPGRLDSAEARDHPQRRPEDTPEPVLNSDSLAPLQLSALNTRSDPGSL